LARQQTLEKERERKAKQLTAEEVGLPTQQEEIFPSTTHKIGNNKRIESRVSLPF